MTIQAGPRELRVAVLMACHNRRETTLRCLEALHAQEGLEGALSFQVFLLDDGSTDGTGPAVRERYPLVRVIQGDGNYFWAGGMRRAWEVAVAVGGFDAYLWLNDDTHLDGKALRKVLDLHESLATKQPLAILVGATRDPLSGGVTYGGRLRGTRWNPLRLSLIPECDSPACCETFNGNFIWVPAKVVERIGILGKRFIHNLADVDYGLRARQAGIPSMVIPGTVGTCVKDHGLAPWEDHKLSLRERWKKTVGSKCLPPTLWVPLAIRHGGWAGPVIALWPYLKLLRRPKM